MLIPIDTALPITIPDSAETGCYLCLLKLELTDSCRRMFFYRDRDWLAGLLLLALLLIFDRSPLLLLQLAAFSNKASLFVTYKGSFAACGCY